MAALALSSGKNPDDRPPRFDCELRAFAEAERRGCVREMAAVAKSLIRLGTGERRSAALTCDALSALSLGETARAAERIDAAERLATRAGELVEAAAAWVVRAKIALVREVPRAAAELAGRAHLLLRERHPAERAALVVLVQAKRRSGETWTFPSEALRWPFTSYSRAALEIEQARALLCARREEAIRFARALFVSCKLNGYERLAARAAATVAVGGLLASDNAFAAEWIATSLGCLLRTGDRFCAHDLFAFADVTAGEAVLARLRESLVDKLFTRYAAIVPQIRADERGQQSVVREFIAAILETVWGDATRDAIVPAIAALNASNSALLHYARGRERELADPIALALYALCAYDGREAMERRVQSVVARAVQAFVPGSKREFYVKA